MAKMSQDEVKKIAEKIHDEGFQRAESFPIARWRKYGWPENARTFRLVDAYMNLFRQIEEFGSW